MRTATVAALLLIGIAGSLLGVRDASAQSRNNAQATVAKWYRAHQECERGSGDYTPCAQRDMYAVRLHELGWCYARRGQRATEYSWHKCQSDSIRAR